MQQPNSMPIRYGTRRNVRISLAAENNTRTEVFTSISPSFTSKRFILGTPDTGTFEVSIRMLRSLEVSQRHSLTSVSTEDLSVNEEQFPNLPTAEEAIEEINEERMSRGHQYLLRQPTCLPSWSLPRNTLPGTPCYTHPQLHSTPESVSNRASIGDHPLRSPTFNRSTSYTNGFLNTSLDQDQTYDLNH